MPLRSAFLMPEKMKVREEGRELVQEWRKERVNEEPERFEKVMP